MDKMIGGFNDRAEIAANSLYPIGIDGNCTKQEIFLEGCTWAFNQIRGVLESCSDLGNNPSESEYWTNVIFGVLTAPINMDDLIVGERAKEEEE